MAGAASAQMNPPASPDLQRQQRMGAAILGMPMMGGAGPQRGPSPAGPPAGGNQAKEVITAALNEIADKISSIIPVVESSAPALMPLLHMMVKVGVQMSKQLESGGGAKPEDEGEGEPAGGGNAP
jgi:hypothetical protein